ncbi:MAG: hypothetical protein R3E77_15265 [Steroidobacteraceae bacterium]
MNTALLFALCAGCAAALWAIFLKLGSNQTTAALGAAIVSATALLVNLGIVMGLKAGGQSIELDRRAVLFLVLAGIAAAGADAFALLTFGRGLRLSSAFIINATATAIVFLIGIAAFREPINASRVAALALIGGGMLWLNYQNA